MNIDSLLGKTLDHLVQIAPPNYLMHEQAVTDFLRLQKEAKNEGFDLRIISAFRDYEKQLRIWNLKASGEKQLLDDQERVLDFSRLSPYELVLAILRWSAIPGCSRHHWGTDIDVYDGQTQKPQEVMLIPSETQGEGPSARLHEWLDIRIASNSAFGFYRPYGNDRGGIAPERWHLSYYPLSRLYMDAYTLTLFKKNLGDEKILHKEVLLDHAEEFYERFFLNIDFP
jgi:LAS superfamily LD-carboxypeptidase LdcB